MDTPPKYVSACGMRHDTPDEACLRFIRNHYPIMSPTTLVIYEVKEVRVRCWVEDRKWHFKVVENES